MTTIFDLAQEQQVNQPVAPPKVDEKAQLVLNGFGIPPFLMRYRTVKNAKRDYDLILVAWAKMRTGKHNGIVILRGDMFESVIDLSCYANVSIVDIEKRLKFIPYTG